MLQLEGEERDILLLQLQVLIKSLVFLKVDCK
jgi:hypothetical protein